MGEVDKHGGEIPATSLRYRLNLLLFLILTILLMIWFYRHFYLYVTQSLIIGGGLTLLGVVKIIQSLLKWGAKEDTETLATRILGKRRSSIYLLSGLVLVAILFLTTSSIYLKYKGVPSSKPEFEIQILRDNKPYMKKLKLRDDDRISGQPFFFRFNSPKLVFKIIKPPGYEDKKERFWPWKSLHFDVPKDFKLKESHILCLIPGNWLYHLLPTDINSALKSYKICITRKKDKNIEIDNLCGQDSVYIGENAGEIQREIDRSEAKRTRKNELKKYFCGEKGFPESAFLERLDMYELNTREEIATPGFRPGEHIKISVMRVGSNEIIIKEKGHTIASKRGIEIIFLEGK